MFETDALALASPSGKMSKRALKSAQERVRRQLFGDGLRREKSESTPESEAIQLRRQARSKLRDLANRGMKPRACRKMAAQLEAQAAEKMSVKIGA